MFQSHVELVVKERLATKDLNLRATLSFTIRSHEDAVTGVVVSGSDIRRAI